MSLIINRRFGLLKSINSDVWSGSIFDNYVNQKSNCYINNNGVIGSAGSNGIYVLEIPPKANTVTLVSNVNLGTGSTYLGHSNSVEIKTPPMIESVAWLGRNEYLKKTFEINSSYKYLFITVPNTARIYTFEFSKNSGGGKLFTLHTKVKNILSSIIRFLEKEVG